ncbi:MAG: endonuclease/exonuclease/phosphatase family protein [Nocardioides sp.]|nr:endonuclease/exonuclease/phosphatase family protein [Nocardioides sp.]
MLRRNSPVRVSFALASAATALTLTLGVVLVPQGQEPGTPRAAADLVGAPVAERVTTTSRDSERATAAPAADEVTESDVTTAGPDAAPVSGGSRGSDTGRGSGAADLPAYTVQDSGKPITELPALRVRTSDQVLRKLPPGPVPGDPFTFQIGTLNILGSQHARNGTGRAAALAGAIAGRGVDLVGLQEVQDDQLAVLRARLDGYSIWPGQSLGNQGVRLQIAFRDSLFEMVDSGSITTVFDFQQRPVPWVTLRERATGAEFHVIDVHNSPGGQEAGRDSATGEEIGLINSLKSTGKPVFIMGDTNEHTEFACRVAAATGMVGSNGLNASGGCNAGAGPIKIDHVLGVGGVDFSDHVVDYGAPVAASTDHAFVHATVTVTPGG